MPVRWAVASGNFSNLAIWNDSASLGFPTASDEVWANSFNVNIDQSFEVVGLRNNARARDIATPQMTGYTTPQGTAISSGDNGFSTAWRAFNRTATSVVDQRWQSTTNNAGWVGFQFNNGLTAKVINQYLIYGSSTLANNPNSWTFEGSNDGSNWTVLHTVTGTTIGAGSTYSSPLLANTTSYEYYRINVTAVGTAGNTIIIPDIEFYERFTAALAAGGSFIFNSGSISGSATSTTAALTAGATNLIQVTAATGSVTLNVPNSSIIPTLGTPNFLINHSGNCNFIINTQNIDTTSTVNCITKASTGTITLNANLIATGGTCLTATAGSIVVNGNIIRGASSAGNGIFQTSGAGTLTINGNVTGGGGTGFAVSFTGNSLTLNGNITAAAAVAITATVSTFTIIGNVTGGTGTSAFGINHSGTSGSVIGNVTGGAGNGAHGISTVGALTVTGTVTGGTGTTANGIASSGVVNVTGNVTGNAGNGVSNSTATVTIIGNVTGGSTVSGLGLGSANNANITGTVSAGTQTGINSTGGTIFLTGNMLNVAGRQAIFAQNLFISDTATTQWRLFTPGGQDKTLYSADTFPNQPSSANVRSGSLFGPSNVLSGSMVVPSPSDVRVNVLTDNTVGTGQSLTAADFLAAISASADPYAQRLRNVATVDTVGSLLTGFNNGGF